MEGMTLEKLQVIIEAQTKAYYEELKKVQNQTKSATSAVEKQTEKIKSAFSKIGKAVGLALSVTAIISFGKSCIELGSALAEVQNVVDVTFGAMSGTINQFARDALEQFGLSETSAKKYTSTMGAMLKSMGFTTQAAASMSMEMTGLAADMASFYNLDSETAFEKIRAGISGETEPLKQLGINMSVANLEAYALSQGITKAYNAMTQQEQAMLRYNYLMQATSDAQGDFARTSDGWANQVRVLSERFNALKAAIGQGLIAVLTPVVRVLNELLAKILTVTDAFSNMMGKITGKNTKATTTVQQVATATDEVGESAVAAAKSMGGLLSMDEVHSLTDNSSGGSGGSGSGSGTAADGLSESVVDAANETDTALNPVLENLIAKLKELQGIFTNGFKSGFGNVDFSGITKSVDGIKTSIQGIFTDPEVLNAGNNFVNTFTRSLGQVTGSVASIGTTVATNVLGGIDKYLGDNQGRIKQHFTNMFDIGSEITTIQGNFSEAAAEIFSVFGGENGQQVTANIIGIFADATMGVNELAGKLGRDVLDLITRPFIDNKEGFSTALDDLLGVAGEHLGNIKTLVEDTLGKANEVYDEHLAPLFNSLSEGLSSITGTVIEAFDTYILPALQRLQEKAGVLMSEHIQPAIDKALELIGKIADAVKDIWEQTLVPFINWFIENVGPYIVAIWEEVSTSFMRVAGVVWDAIGNILDTLGGLIDFIAGVFTGDWERAWDGIKTFFSGIWETIKGIVVGIWNAIKAHISSVIGIISSVISTVLNTIKTVFSTIWNSIKTTVSTVWNGIKTTISTVVDTIKTSISNVLSNISSIWSTMWNGMKTTVTNIFDGIWSSIKGVINSILGGIESMANGVIRGINGMIDAMNNLSFDVPDWVPGIGGETFGFNIPTLSTVSLPRLAAGGVVDQATVAMIGEAGKEAVVPLENNTGWMDKIAARLGEIISVNMQAIIGEMDAGDDWQTIKTVVQLDSKTLVEQTDKFRRRKGYQMANA